MPSDGQVGDWKSAARRCLEEADRTPSPGTRQQLLDLAERYSRLVQRAEQEATRRAERAPETMDASQGASEDKDADGIR
jgi:hypothetical protein